MHDNAQLTVQCLSTCEHVCYAHITAVLLRRRARPNALELRRKKLVFVLGPKGICGTHVHNLTWGYLLFLSTSAL